MSGLSNDPLAPRAYWIGSTEVRPETNTVIVNGEERYLRQQAMQVLTYLLQRPGELVSKEALHSAIWNDTAVTHDALVQCVVEIRKTLGDDPRRPQFVRTVPKGGYSFIGPVAPRTEPAARNDEVPTTVAPIQAAAVPPPGRGRWTVVVAAVLVVIGIAAGVSWLRPAAALDWPAQPGKARVIVLAFDNQSRDAELDWLRRGLPEMLATDLSQSPGLNVLAPSQLTRLIGDQPIDLSAAIAAAKRASADAVITGAFSSVGDALRVDARVHQADGTLLGTETLTAARREVVLAEVDRVAGSLARALGQPLPANQAASGLSDVMTGDLTAYREYSLGVEKANGLQPEAALAHFAAAAAADPNFAMAHARIGYTYAVTLGLHARGEPFLAKAFQLSDRLRERDRLLILAWYALAKLDYEGALSPLRSLIARYPDDLETYWLLSRTLRGEERWNEARDVIMAGLRVDPNAKELRNELSSLYSASWQLDLALAEVQKYLALSPNEPNAHDSVGLVLQQAGRYEEALTAYQQALELDPGFEPALFHIGNVYAEQGRYREALAAYQRNGAILTMPHQKARARAAMAWIHLYRGDQATAWREVTASILDPDSISYNVAFFAHARGDRARFEQEMRKPLIASTRGVRYPRVFERCSNGRLAQAQGRHEDALTAFRDAVARPPVTWGFPTLDDCLGQGLLDLGRLDEAAAEYRRLLARTPAAARYQYRLAQIAERQGRSREAADGYERFLSLWPRADQDGPEVQAARAALKKLSRAAATH